MDIGSSYMNKKSNELTEEFKKEVNAPKKSGGWVKWLALVLVVLVLWKVSAAYGLLSSSTFPAVSADKWQTIFLTDGEVFFGHLDEVNKDYVVLEDVYYLRINQQLQPSDPDQPNINLVKLGDELHGPEDQIFILKTQIKFWENMKDDAPVVQAIESTL